MGAAKEEMIKAHQNMTEEEREYECVEWNLAHKKDEIKITRNMIDVGK